MTKINFKLDYYAMLKIKQTASEKEIRTAYRKCARLIHPDKCNKSNAKELFQEISSALEVLTDPKKKKVYDEHWLTNAEEYKKSAELEKKKREEEIKRKKREEEFRIKREKEIAEEKRRNDEIIRLKKKRMEAEAKRLKEEKKKREEEELRIKKEREERLRKKREEEEKEEKERLEEIRRKEKELMESKRLYASSAYNRYLIGKKGENIKNIRETYNMVDFQFKEDYIYFQGPQYQISLVKKVLKKQLDILIDTIAFDELDVEENMLCNIYKIVGNIRRKHSVTINMPSNKFGPITFEGSPKDVDASKKELEEFIKKLKNQVTKTIKIPIRFHGLIIGKGGSGLNAYRCEYPSIKIRFPDVKLTSDSVEITGESDHVENTITKLLAKVDELEKQCHEITLKVDSNHFAILMKQRLSVAKKTNTTVKVIADEVSFLITGTVDNVLAAKNEFLDLQKKLNDTITVELDIEEHLINSICTIVGNVSIKHSVTINMPSNKSGPITFVGSTKAVDASKKELEEFIEKLKNQVTKTIKIPSRFHGLIIGKGGSGLNAYRCEYPSIKIRFPAVKLTSDIVEITGESDHVENTIKKLLAKVDELEKQCHEITLKVDSNHFAILIKQRSLVAKKTNTTVKVIADEVSFLISGKVDNVLSAKNEFLDLQKKLNDTITVELDIEEHLINSICTIEILSHMYIDVSTL